MSLRFVVLFTASPDAYRPKAERAEGDAIFETRIETEAETSGTVGRMKESV